MLITFAKKYLYDQVGNKEDFSSRSIQGRFFQATKCCEARFAGLPLAADLGILDHLVAVRSVTVGDERRPNQRSIPKSRAKLQISLEEVTGGGRSFSQ